MPVEKADVASSLAEAGLLTTELRTTWAGFLDATAHGVRGPAIDEHLVSRSGLPPCVVAHRLALAERVVRADIDVSTLLSRLGLLGGAARDPASILTSAVERLAAMVDDAIGAGRSHELPTRWPAGVPVSGPPEAATALTLAAGLLHLLLADLMDQPEEPGPAAPPPSVEADLRQAAANLAGVRGRLDELPVVVVGLSDKRRLAARDLWIESMLATGDRDRSCLLEAERLLVDPASPGDGAGLRDLAGADSVGDHTRKVLLSTAAALDRVGRGDLRATIQARAENADGSLRVAVRDTRDGRVVLDVEASRGSALVALVRLRVLAATHTAPSQLHLATPLGATVSGAWRAGYDLGDTTQIVGIEVDPPQWLPLRDLTDDMIHAAFVAFAPDDAASRAWRLVERSAELSGALRSALDAVRAHRDRLSHR